MRFVRSLLKYMAILCVLLLFAVEAGSDPPSLPPETCGAIPEPFLHALHAREEYILISGDPEGMGFGLAGVGANESENTPYLTVETTFDYPEITVHFLKIEMSALRREDGEAEIPTSAVCLAWGFSPDQARQNARDLAFGENRLTWYFNPGRYIIYLCARLDIDPAVEPGHYSGQIRVNWKPFGGEPVLMDVEVDVRLYAETTIRNHKIYFHIGNIFTASAADLTAHVNGTLTSNSGQYVGLVLGQGEAQKAGGVYTGVVEDAMIGTRDVSGRSVSEETFDLEIMLDWGVDYRPPVDCGDDEGGIVQEALWWLVDDGQAGAYDLDWRIRLLPKPHQADGDYSFSLMVVVAPAL